ncbi:MAG TPA: hypothetical protein VJ227_01500 [Patescibacteria group bacterium]|nr:hypothetical protein [Patescibacteria group bacterium]
MGKTLTYSGFLISAFLVIFAFVTAKTYTQLAIAVLLYPLIAFFALKLFPRKTNGVSNVTTAVQISPRPYPKAEDTDNHRVEVADVDKRTFLKLIGAAGLSFFIFSLLGRRVETLLFGKAMQSRVDELGGAPSTETSPTTGSPTEGYRIAEIEDGVITYYGFTNKSGGWLIMKEVTDSSSFRYAKGESDFPGNWANRENLKYDYFYNLF